LLDITRNYKTLIWKESFRKPLIGKKAFLPCKAVYAGSIPTPASNPRDPCRQATAKAGLGGRDRARVREEHD